MSKSKILSIRLSEQTYQELVSQAAAEEKTVGEIAKTRITNGNSTNITPDLVVTITGVYNILCLDPKSWNQEMQNQVKKGMSKIYAFLQKNHE